MIVVCLRCGRRLTNPKSVERRYGPVCIKKINEPFSLKLRNLVEVFGLGDEEKQSSLRDFEVFKKVVEYFDKQEKLRR